LANFTVNLTNFPTTYTTSPYCVSLIIPAGRFFCKTLVIDGVERSLYFNGGLTSVQTAVFAADTASTGINSIVQQLIIYTDDLTSISQVISSVVVYYI
jgi:hypothetical protein